MNYSEFLKTKEKHIIESGFEINESELNDMLYTFQKFTVKKALKHGKYAIFADTGQGKTPMQLEIAHQVSKKTDKPSLILSPLAVSGQTILQGDKFESYVYKLDAKKQKTIAENKFRGFPDKGEVYIINYDQIDNIDFDLFGCILLDESSILKNETGKFRNKLIGKCKNIPYKFCFSATPSPNDPTELGNHAEFLDVMTFNEMMAMYFVNDSKKQKGSKWRLKGHGVDKFYDFVSTWAIMYSHPKDIGFNQDGFDLPELEVVEKQVKTKIPDGHLFGGLAVNATDYNKSLRETEIERINETLGIIKSIPKGEPIIIWTKQNEEAKKVHKYIIGLGLKCRNVQGSDSSEEKEKNLLGFAKGDFQILITKQSIASQGLNYQHCAYQIFNSVDFSFEQSYQAIRRSWRFGQKRKVTIFMVTTDRMINVVKTQQDKHKQFKIMQEKMTKAVLKNLNNQITSKVTELPDFKTEKFHLMHGDCVKRIKEVPDNSIDIIVFSPPFADLYTYSNHIEDMGNVTDYEQFKQQFAFLLLVICLKVRICTYILNMLYGKIHY
jgi:superfamily II DNA or RNA helicase